MNTMNTWHVRVRQAVRQTARRFTMLRRQAASAAYHVVDQFGALDTPCAAWHDEVVAVRQDAAYRSLIQEMYAGRPRIDLRVAAEAISSTGLTSPSVLEVGCGSGYYSEVLRCLLPHPVVYVGLDYSTAMISLARRRYPFQQFVVGDATALPFASAAIDIVFNGVALMHIPRYQQAISESRRVARQWCIFHTVPVLQQRKTTYLRKLAYGRPVVEVVLNEQELTSLLQANGLAIRYVFDSVPYDLQAVLGEPTVTKTYVCEVCNDAA